MIMAELRPCFTNDILWDRKRLHKKFFPEFNFTNFSFKQMAREYNERVALQDCTRRNKISKVNCIFI